MLLQRSPGKNSWKRTKEQQSYRVLQEAVPHWDDSPEASHPSKSLSSFPISPWTPQSILALGFPTGHLTFTVCPAVSFAGESSPCQCWVRALAAFPLWHFPVSSRSQKNLHLPEHFSHHSSKCSHDLNCCHCTESPGDECWVPSPFPLLDILLHPSFRLGHKH